MHKPQEHHWKPLKHILCYLIDIAHHGLFLESLKSLSVIGFCDVNWESNTDDRKLTIIFCVHVGPNVCLLRITK